MSLSFHIDFNGQCEEAFRFYAEHLGGKIGTMLRVKDSPATASSESKKDKIVHANMRIDGTELAGADVEPNRYERPQGFYVLLGVDSEEKVRSFFNALQTGGQMCSHRRRHSGRHATQLWSTVLGFLGRSTMGPNKLFKSRRAERRRAA